MKHKLPESKSKRTKLGTVLQTIIVTHCIEQTMFLLTMEVLITLCHMDNLTARTPTAKGLNFRSLDHETASIC